MRLLPETLAQGCDFDAIAERYTLRKRPWW